MAPVPQPPVIAAFQRLAVRYSLTRGDVLRWQFYTLIRNRVLISMQLILSLFLVWNDLRSPEMAVRPTGFKVFYALVFPLFMFCIVGLLAMLAMVCMVMFKKHRGLLGDHELEIRDEGLIERTDVNESLHRWGGFGRIVRTGRYLYIYVTDSSVHIVPRRYFASEQEEQAFRDELQRRTNAA